MTIPSSWGMRAPARGLTRSYYKVHGAPPYGYLQCVLLGEEMLCGMIHFDRGTNHSVPCPDDGSCWYCAKQIGRRRKGYMPAMMAGSKELFCVELTSNCIDLIATHAEMGQLLRGTQIKLSRRKGKDGNVLRTGKVDVEFMDRWGEHLLPPSFDVKGHLERLWGAVPKEPASPPDIEELRDGP